MIGIQDSENFIKNNPLENFKDFLLFNQNQITYIRIKENYLK